MNTDPSRSVFNLWAGIIGWPPTSTFVQCFAGGPFLGILHNRQCDSKYEIPGNSNGWPRVNTLSRCLSHHIWCIMSLGLGVCGKCMELLEDTPDGQSCFSSFLCCSFCLYHTLWQLAPQHLFTKTFFVYRLHTFIPEVCSQIFSITKAVNFLCTN